jgi:Protein of unknown function (DUF3558)
VIARVAAAALAATALLSGCASGDSSSSDPTPTPTGSPQEVAWSPCDGVTAAEVGRYAGEPMTEQTGTADQPRCAFTPVKKGGAAFDVNYLWFDGGLDQAWQSMGKVAGRVTDIHVAGADAGRLVVHAGRPAVLVTGFVQVGGLVQSVNAVQLRPYDEQSVVGATRRLLAQLVRHAPDSAGSATGGG